MKTIIYVALIIAAIIAAILGLAYVFEGINVDQLKEYSTKIGLGILIVTVLALIVKGLLRSKNQV